MLGCREGVDTVQLAGQRLPLFDKLLLRVFEFRLGDTDFADGGGHRTPARKRAPELHFHSTRFASIELEISTDSAVCTRQLFSNFGPFGPDTVSREMRLVVR
jgi:hypothetical protein